jgi:hypothetical protein
VNCGCWRRVRETAEDRDRLATPWFQVLGKTMRQGEAPYYSLKPRTIRRWSRSRMNSRKIVRQYRPAVERYTLELPSDW